MYKLKERKGFTLAELLIVVAIIAVLVAVAIPVFTSQLERSREATDMANIRSAYATVTNQFLQDGASHALTVTAQQRQANWQNSELGNLEVMNESGASQVAVTAKTSGDYSIAIDTNGSVTVN